MIQPLLVTPLLCVAIWQACVAGIRPLPASPHRVQWRYFALLGGACFVLAAVLQSMPGVYGGGACVVAVLILLGYTTISDIKEALTSAKDVVSEAKSRPIGFTSDMEEEGR